MCVRIPVFLALAKIIFCRLTNSTNYNFIPS
jgi:hypothetical protein